MKKLTWLLLVGLLLAVGIVPTLAQTTVPAITVAPVWRQPVVLTSLDTAAPAYPHWDIDDDYRYIDVDLYTTTNIQFWAAQITCTATPTILNTYVADVPSATGDPGDNPYPVQPGSIWGTLAESVSIPPVYNPTTGALTFTLSRMGNGVLPIGQNGVSQTFVLATLRYQVKPQTASPFNGLAKLTCTSAFLDKNGAPVVLAPIFTPPPDLKVVSGYSINGTVRYQGRTTHAGIGVHCSLPADPTSPVLMTRTTATGAFAINNIRVLTTYLCWYFGQNITVEVAPVEPYNNPDVYLQVNSTVELNTNSVTLLPITLPLGNSARNAPGVDPRNEVIDTLDITDVTNNWNLPVPASSNYGPGDINNDKKVDKTDLAVVTGNYGLHAPVNGEHILISAQRSYDASSVYPSNRMWVNASPVDMVGDLNLTQYLAGANRDFWPAVSPDGSKLAFIRAVGTGNAATAVSTAPLLYSLFVMNSDGTGTATQLTPIAGKWTLSGITTYDSFAPSWSPDGSQIAFICTTTQGTKGGWRDMQQNNGAVCVIDANGRNLRKVGWDAKIYPPAWTDKQALIYGGTSNGLCRNTLCLAYVDRPAGSQSQQPLDSDLLPIGNDFYDMPVVRGDRLFYRYQTSPSTTMGTATLRVATFDSNLIGTDPLAAYQSDIGAIGGAPWNTDVSVVGIGGSVTNNLDYFTVGPKSDLGYNILYGTYYAGSGWYSSGFSFYRLPAGGTAGTVDIWNSPTLVGLSNPTSNPTWNGEFSCWPNCSPTDLFGLRISMNWVP